MAMELLWLILRIFFFSFLITLPFFYDLNNRYRYYFKFFIYYALVAFTNTLVVPFTVYKPLRRLSVTITVKFCYVISRLLNIQWKVTGENNLKSNEPCIVIVQQQQDIDVLGAFTTDISARNYTLIKQELSGPFAHVNRLHSLPFTNKIKDCEAQLFLSTVIKDVRSKNINLWIFSSKMENLKDDVFYLAVKEKIPIVPVIFSNYYFLDEQRKIFDSGRVIIEILFPIETKNSSVDDVPLLFERTKLSMENARDKLSQRVTPLKIADLRNCYSY